jgi:hypothetical protein
MRQLWFISKGAWVLLLMFSFGCQKEESSAPGSVILKFDYIVGDQELVLDEFRYTCTSGHDFSVVRLRYYVSNFGLQQSAISSDYYFSDVVQYVDVNEPQSNSLVLENVPPGKYNKLTFVFGLGEQVNVDGGLPNTITNINMEWPLPGDQGYHYMKFEGKYDSLGTGVIKNYNLHTGATGGNQNYIFVSLPIDPIEINDSRVTINIEMDLNEWLQNPFVYDFETFGPMIMNNQEAQSILKANGATVFCITGVEKE